MDPERSDPHGWIMRWYASQCDGDWEHEHGMSIETIDNPGWALEVSFAERRSNRESSPECSRSAPRMTGSTLESRTRGSSLTAAR